MKFLLTLLRFVLLVLLAVTGLAARAATAAVAAGQAVTLSLTVDGAAPFTYKWFKNGVALAGARASTYVIANFQAANAGKYSALVSNESGSTISDSATLVLAVPPVITAESDDQTVAAGKAVTFSVTATGSPAPTYQWLRNGASIAGATGRTYTIASVTTGHAGGYSVQVTNPAGSLRSKGSNLTVTPASSAPVITTQPAGLTVIEGSNVTLAVVATGSPTLTYQWRKNGVSITGATASKYVITAVTAAQAGSYSVIVKNAAGTVTSRNAVLEVNPPLPVHADFNGDGRSDILWQNILTGEQRVWLMNGTRLAKMETLDNRTTDWAGIGVADFDGDGQNDILRQNLLTRESNLWLMAGTTEGTRVSLGVAPVGMLMAGTDDFNADGMPDILWKNVVAGTYSIRFMDGVATGASVVIGNGPVGWTVGGTGDFNGDGKPDILWQRATDGAARVWLMKGGAYVSATDLGAMGLGWSLGGTGDFNGDGHTDILWQNTLTGACKVALMSGLTKTGEASLGVAALEWIMTN